MCNCFCVLVCMGFVELGCVLLVGLMMIVVCVFSVVGIGLSCCLVLLVSVGC